MGQDELVLELARFIERITAIGRTGLAFKPHGYDAERYEDLLREAARIHAVLARDLATDPDALLQRWRDRPAAATTDTLRWASAAAQSS